MKRFLIFLSLCFGNAASAQDQLFKTDNTKILVKVLEVGPEEIRYKRFDNLTGPTYVEAKKNVSVIIYESGQHQVFTQAGSKPSSAPSETVAPDVPAPVPQPTRMTQTDSLIYFGNDNSLGLNFLNFFNNEVGIIYRREFFSRQFNIVIPVAFGLSRPAVTQSFYFSNNNARINLQNKNFEVGIGIHYYPNLRSKTNYYIGPVLRYMQYDCHQQIMTPSWPTYLLAENYTTLSRTAFSITNGVVYRTRSRLTLNMFISLGFKNDMVAEPLRDGSGNVLNTLNDPLGFYWWSGFEIGFSF